MRGCHMQRLIGTWQIFLNFLEYWHRFLGGHPCKFLSCTFTHFWGTSCSGWYHCSAPFSLFVEDGLLFIPLSWSTPYDLQALCWSNQEYVKKILLYLGLNKQWWQLHDNYFWTWYWLWLVHTECNNPNSKAHSCNQFIVYSYYSVEFVFPLLFFFTL